MHSDSDFVLVNASCCPCLSGGRMQVIHQSLVESYNEKIKKQCSASPSFSYLTVYLCGNWKAECVNSSCKVVSKTSS